MTAVCSKANFDLLKSLGADKLIDYKTITFTTQSDKYDVIFDCSGNQPFRACQPVMRGKWVHITTMPTVTAFLRQFLNPLFTGKVIALVAKPTG